MTAAVDPCAPISISRTHVAPGKPRRVRLSVSFGMLLARETIIPSWDPEGKVFVTVIMSEFFFLLARSDVMFTAGSAAVHFVDFLTRDDLAVYAEGAQQLEHMQLRQARRVEVWFKCHKKSDQESIGSVRVWTWDEVLGSKSSFRLDVGAVALIFMELMSYFSSILDHALLSSYRCGKSVRVVRCGRALRALK